MIKHLPVFILLLLVFGTANAQTHEDSTKNQPAKVIEKIQIVDTAGKRSVIDTVTKKDTTNLDIKADTAIKSVVVVRSAVDSVSRSSPVVKPLADSTVKQPKTDSAVKVKPQVGKKTVKYTVTVKITPPPPDKVIKHSTVRSLSDEQYNALLRGDDLDSMSLVGIINHYPLPDQALKYKAQIGLNPGQITKLKAMATELHRKKVEMGENIIRNEKMLDSLFHGHMVVDGTLIFYTNRSGLYYGELKGAILMACYRTEQILSDDQIRKLEALLKGHSSN